MFPKLTLGVKGVKRIWAVTKTLFFTFAGYRYLQNVDETDCRAICLLDENCMAVQYTMFWRGCKLLDTTKKLTAVNANAKSFKIVVFLPRLQREKKNFILYQLKVKPNQQRRGEEKASNVTVCSSYCAQDAFCQAFVMCSPVQGSWCEKTRGNCFLYSKQQITAVEKDEHSDMHFVWKNYAQV